MSRLILKLVSRLHVLLYRVSGGRLGGRIGRRAPVLLLTTIGRKTGKRRTIPLLYVEQADRYIVIASVGGAPTHPDWYLNLRSNPAATIQLGSRTLAVRAEMATAAERARLWTQVTQMYPRYDDYQAKTTREIPVVILTPSTPAHS